MEHRHPLNFSLKPKNSLFIERGAFHSLRGNGTLGHVIEAIFPPLRHDLIRLIDSDRYYSDSRYLDGASMEQKVVIHQGPLRFGDSSQFCLYRSSDSCPTDNYVKIAIDPPSTVASLSRKAEHRSADPGFLYISTSDVQ